MCTVLVLKAKYNLRLHDRRKNDGELWQNLFRSFPLRIDSLEIKLGGKDSSNSIISIRRAIIILDLWKWTFYFLPGGDDKQDVTLRVYRSKLMKDVIHFMMKCCVVSRSVWYTAATRLFFVYTCYHANESITYSACSSFSRIREIGKGPYES